MERLSQSSVDGAPRLLGLKEGGIKILEDADRAAAELLLSHLLGLRGQIHESKGFVRLGRTLCLDPMSEYSDGVLRGALVGLADGKAQEYLFTSG